jgi:hypothetical protein
MKERKGIENAQVQVIPFEEVILTTNKPPRFYQLTNSWIPFEGQKVMNFRLIVDSELKCQQQRNRMRSDPQFFSDFLLKFNVAAARSGSRIALIRVDSIRKGSLYSQLDQKFPLADSILLTAEDTKRLLSESTTMIMVETFDDNEVPSASSEARIFELVEKLMIETQIIINDQSSNMWSSVFFQKENYRPDQITKTISDVFRRSDNEGRKMLSSVYSNSVSNNIDTALELIKYRLTKRSDSDATSSSDSEQSAESSSSKTSNSSSNTNDTEGQKRKFGSVDGRRHESIAL